MTISADKWRKATIYYYCEVLYFEISIADLIEHE